MITQRRMLEILEKGRVDDRQSLYCDLFLSILIVVNLIAVCLETIDSLFAQYKTIFVAVELISVSIFSIEYVLRIWSRPAAPNEHGKTAMGK
ncbi:MAG: ion transporter, partial [Proteobacteria bacterium]|nr:ion transporter [Pseudomonadota bacterium]